MTSVPKPLKFLRPHYGKLKEIYESMAPGENKVKLFQKLVEASFRDSFSLRPMGLMGSHRKPDRLEI